MENCNRMIYSKNDIYKVREYYKAGQIQIIILPYFMLSNIFGLLLHLHEPITYA